MLSYSEIKPKKFILVDNEPYEVLSSHVFRKQQRKPVNQTKLRHLKTGKVTEYSFHQSESVEEADLSKKEVEYLYNTRGKWWFCIPNNPSDRFDIDESLIGEASAFLKENELVEALVLDEEILGINLPIKVILKVAETPPGVRGNTAQGGTKPATLETGAIVNVPLFINEGDLVEVNTETGEYVSRAS